MEKTSAAVTALAIVVIGIVLTMYSITSHEDNNREKKMIETCILAGGQPDIAERSGSMRSCNR